MSTPPPITISDEMVEAYCAASADWLTEYRSEVRAGLEAVAPLIAVQVLRLAVEAIRPLTEQAENSGDVFGEEGGAYLREAITTIESLAAESGRERSPEPKEPKRRCPRCGSREWVSVSLDEGYTRLAQCVPCGAMHPGVIGPGWRTEEYQRAAQRRERSEPSKGSSTINPDGRRSLTEDTP